MAFTSDGMFYLSQEDYAPTMDILGGGVRGLFGLQNKEEAVESVLRRTNPDDPASRESALMEIAAIDPDAWARVSAIFNEIETSRIGLEEKRLDLKSKKGEAARNAKWAYEVKPNVARLISKDHGYEASSRTELVKLLNADVNSGKIKAGARSSILSDFDNRMKVEKQNWETTHKHTDFSLKDSTTTGSFLTGLPEKKKVDDKSKTTNRVTLEEYNADPRPAWQKGTIWNYRPPVKKKEGDVAEDPIGA